MKVHVRQVLSPASNRAKSVEATKARKLFVKEMAAIPSSERVGSWSVPARRVPVLIFPVTIMALLGNMYKYLALLEKSHHILLSKGPEKYRGRLKSVDVNMVLAPDTSAQGITVNT